MSEIKIPTAAKKNQLLHKHGDTRTDAYYWLKERDHPEVLQHLKAENTYQRAVMQPVQELEKNIYQELCSRTKADDSTAPFKEGPYYYYQRFEAGREYPIFARRAGSATGPEEILLDVNELARDHAYYSAAFPLPSPDHSKIAFAVDTVGRRFYAIHFKDLKSGTILQETIPQTTGDFHWANDNQTIFFGRQNAQTLRSDKVWRYHLGQKSETLVHEEKDESFYLSLEKSVTSRFLFISAHASESTEFHYCDANQPTSKPVLFAAREPKLEYELHDAGDCFFLLTNYQAKNFRVMQAPHAATAKEYWQELVAHRPDVLLEELLVLEKYIVCSGRFQGLTQLEVLNRSNQQMHVVAFPDPSYVSGLSNNKEFIATAFRYSYESMNRPQTIYDYEFSSAKSVFVKQKEIPNFDASQYASSRVWATARDGTKIPISLLHRKNFVRDGQAPLLVYGYGSYGMSMEPWFSASRLSLVDRGFVYAIAHIRGGSEMGRHWYESGKFLQKKNTFFDFIDSADFLLKEKYGDPKRVYAQGGSAGGLLMGAVINERPDLFRGVVAQVPFVDVLTTMLDDSIPLTTFEYNEWGNPDDKTYYDYLKSYSPYDNVASKPYPHILITSGYHDSQVQYWEPTKWALKLRDFSTSEHFILLKTELEAGHGGTTGRFARLKDIATELSFLLFIDQTKC